MFALEGIVHTLEFLMGLTKMEGWSRTAKLVWLILLPITLPIWCILWTLKFIIIVILCLPLVMPVAAILFIDWMNGRSFRVRANTNKDHESPSE